MNSFSKSKSLSTYDVKSSIRTGALALLSSVLIIFRDSILEVLPYLEATTVNIIENISKEFTAALIALVMIGFDLIRRYVKDYTKK